MKYFRVFKNHAAYTAAESSLALPNLAVCVQEDEVHYKPLADPYVGHDYVDLGLPSGTKWATMNVGASSVTDYGEYYKYGSGATPYTADTRWTYYQGTENPLAASADTAVQVWGGGWHTPTEPQFEELIENTTYEWTTIDGVDGGKFTSQNGRYIFLPGGGNDYDSGSYWSSTPYGAHMAESLYFDDDEVAMDSPNRPSGLTIRPVVG